MKQFEDKHKDTIMKGLYTCPSAQRIQKDIFDKLGVCLHPIQLIQYREQLAAEGLISIVEGSGVNGECDVMVKITKEGYQAMMLFGSYLKWKKDEMKLQRIKRRSARLQEVNMTLTNLKLIFRLISFVFGFIGGMLSTLAGGWLWKILQSQ